MKWAIFSADPQMSLEAPGAALARQLSVAIDKFLAADVNQTESPTSSSR
jgi:hypothetical protein